MKTSVSLLFGPALYFSLALLFLSALIWWPAYTGRALSGSVIGGVGFVASICAFLGFAAFAARKGSPLWVKIFAGGGGSAAGMFGGFVGWKAGLVFAVPLVIGLFVLWR